MCSIGKSACRNSLNRNQKWTEQVGGRVRACVSKSLHYTRRFQLRTQGLNREGYTAVSTVRVSNHRLKSRRLRRA